MGSLRQLKEGVINNVIGNCSAESDGEESLLWAFGAQSRRIGNCFERLSERAEGHAARACCRADWPDSCPTGKIFPSNVGVIQRKESLSFGLVKSDRSGVFPILERTFTRKASLRRA